MIRTALLAVALLAGSAVAARRLLLMATVDGSSMEPVLHDGDRVLVRRTSRARRGQVALLRFPPLPSGEPGSQLLLKRVVAVAGDRLPPNWATPDVLGIGGDLVPADCAVVLGDNRPISWDSRHYGFVPRERVVGVVVDPRR